MWPAHGELYINSIICGAAAAAEGAWLGENVERKRFPLCKYNLITFIFAIELRERCVYMERRTTLPLILLFTIIIQRLLTVKYVSFYVGICK